MNLLRRFLLQLLALALVGSSIAVPSAYAGLIGTDQAATQSERERVTDLISRPEVAKKLEALGVSPTDAAARVDALTQQELSALAQKIDTLPAGGVSENWLWIALVVILLLILL
jgi:hypothetical protein